jgi:hypothetical protein
MVRGTGLASSGARSSEGTASDRSEPSGGNSGSGRQVGPNQLQVVEVIGDSADVSSVTVTSAVANDDGGASAAQALITNVQIVKNCAPEWSEGASWVTTAAARVTDGPVSTVRGNRRFTLSLARTLGLLTLTVEHR